MIYMQVVPQDSNPICDTKNNTCKISLKNLCAGMDRFASLPLHGRYSFHIVLAIAPCDIFKLFESILVSK